MNGKSCTLKLLEVTEDWTEAVDNGKELDAIFYDFRKAFDTISHSKLILKLHKYGIKGSVRRYLGSNIFFTDRVKWLPSMDRSQKQG